MIRSMIAAVVLVVVPALRAQSSSQTAAVPVTSDTVYVQAQRLVNEGKGAEGRALVDSLFRIAAPGSPAQAEALFWRATLATTAAEAERDYRQITVEHPLSPRAEDALLRLAQLELARGDRTLALAHLERLLREHGSGPARARGAYWSARVHFELNDVTRACAALTTARAALPSTDVELRNQIEYAAQRCPAATVAVAPSPDPATTASAPATTPVTPPIISSAPPIPDSTRRTSVDSTPVASPSVTTATAPAVVTAPPPRTDRPTSSAPSTADPQRFSVQVAAYQTKGEADRLVKKYRANGYDARTYGTVAPFRVRIGRFRTRTEAVDLAKILKAKSGAAFVVVAEPK